MQVVNVPAGENEEFFACYSDINCAACGAGNAFAPGLMAMDKGGKDLGLFADAQNALS
jgi:hypothetical protein